MTKLEEIDRELVLYKDYLAFTLTFRSIWEIMVDFKTTGFLMYGNAVPTFKEWLGWNNYPLPNDKG